MMESDDVFKVQSLRIMCCFVVVTIKEELPEKTKKKSGYEYLLSIRKYFDTDLFIIADCQIFRANNDQAINDIQWIISIFRNEKRCAKSFGCL